MKIESQLSDTAVLGELGSRVEQWRLSQNLTQAALADRAGVSKRTVERFEKGEGCQLGAFIGLLRALEKLDTLDLLFPEAEISPMAMLKLKGQRRLKASGKRTASATVARKPWTWGDEA